MSALGVVMSGAMLAEAARMAVPYGCAALGGVIGERSGVVNIALEGTLLASALASIAVSEATGSAFAGAAAGVVCGGAVGALHALLVVVARVDAIVSGIALNLAAAGGTRVVLRALYGSSSNSPAAPAFRVLEGAPPLVRALFDPFLVATVVLVIATGWTLARTRVGMWVRACGEDPSSALAAGVNVTRTRMAAVTLGGAMTGLGGTALAFELRQFQSGMTGGRGYIALAAVVVAGWRPGVAFAACAVFALLDAIQIVMQSQTSLPPEVSGALPFVATLAALGLARRRGAAMQAPAGLGKHPA